MRNPRATGPNLSMLVPLDSQPWQGPMPPQYLRGVLVEDDAHLLSLLAAEREGERAGWMYAEAARASARAERLAHIERYLATGKTHHDFVMEFVVTGAKRVTYL